MSLTSKNIWDPKSCHFIDRSLPILVSYIPNILAMECDNMNFKVIDYDGRDPQSVKKTFYDKKPDVGS